MVLCFDIALNPNQTSMALCLAPNELHHMPFLTVTFSLKFLIKIYVTKYLLMNMFSSISQAWLKSLNQDSMY